MSNKTCGPAFPVHPDTSVRVGMTLLDWFAGQALPAVTSDLDYSRSQEMAMYAYRIADAMVAEKQRREKQGQE